METVELPLNGATEVSKILSVEGFGGGSESRAEGVGKDRGGFGRCSDFSNDMTCRTSASEQNSVSRSKKAYTGLTLFNSPLPNYVDETTASQVGKPLFTGKQLQRKSGKTSNDINFSSKRPRSELFQISMSQGGFGDCTSLGEKHKSGSTASTFAERSPSIGHKHSLDGKRGDKRNFKSPKRPKDDPFYAKIGLMKSSSSGGGNILGMYGLKTDIQDVTRRTDELSLDVLLDGSYKPPIFCQNKGKSAANTNENLVDTVRKACSILQTWKPVETKNDTELDSSLERKIDTCVSSSGSSIASGTDCIKEENNVEDLATSSKDAGVIPVTSPLAEPKDVLEQITLPPAKSLDAFLLDMNKSALSRGTSELWLSKTMVYGASLQPFPWSNSSVGPSKKAIDTGKLPNNRSRWVRIGSTVNSPDDTPNLIDMNSLELDRKSSISSSDALTVHNSLDVPLPQRISGSFDWQLKPGISTEKLLKAPKEEDELTYHDKVAVMVPCMERQKFLMDDSKQSTIQSNCDSASSSHYSPFKGSVGGLDVHQWQLDASEKLIHAGHSPRLVTASLTLYEMARRPATENLNYGKFRWPKKSSQKTMKARKPRSTGKTEALFSIPRSILGPNDSVKMDKTFPSKKPKYSDNKKLDIRHTITNHVGREPIKWSVPTSSRSPPTRSDHTEARKSNSDSVRLGTTPPYKRGLDRDHKSELRKAVPMDWGRGKHKN